MGLRLIGLLALSLAALTACHSSSNVDSTASQYQYEFKESVNGASCTTDKQVFGNKSDMCAGLQNEDLNHQCAADQRSAYFKSQQCPNGNSATSTALNPTSSAPRQGAGGNLDQGIYPKFVSESIAKTTFFLDLAQGTGVCTSGTVKCQPAANVEIQLTVMGGPNVVVQVVDKDSYKWFDSDKSRLASMYFTAVRAHNQAPLQIEIQGLSGINGGWATVPSGTRPALQIQITSGNLLKDSVLLGDIYVNGLLEVPGQKFDLVKGP